MPKYVNRGKRQFSEREKRAYSAGRGYAAAKKGKRIKCNTEKEKQSFRNGVKSVTERAPAVAKAPVESKASVKGRGDKDGWAISLYGTHFANLSDKQKKVVNSVYYG